MIQTLRRLRTGSFVVVFVCALASAASAQQQVVRIGIAIDGPWERNEQIRASFEREIQQILEDRYDVQFPAEKRLVADWTAAGVKQNIDRLLADPDVTHVLTLGALSSIEAARRGPLPKPVVAPYVFNRDLLGIPSQVREERAAGRPTPTRYRVSGVQNLSYVDVDTDLLREVRMFLEIVPFQRLTFLVVKALTDALPELRDNIRNELAPLNLDLTMVPVGESLEQALGALPADTEAVYVAPLLQLPPGGFDRLAEALIDRKLPSFSLWGQSEVRRGLMASLALDRLDTERDASRLARRAALNLHRILLGEPAAELPVDFALQERLTINMATARAIDVWPSFALMTEAELLSQTRQQTVRTISLADVIREASTTNLDLAAADRTVAAGQRLVREARSNLLPQVDVSGLGLLIDEDRAGASFGSQGQRQASGSIGLNQLVYSEDARAGYDIERNLQTRREEERGELRLDVIQEAANSYLSVLRGLTVERIQRENLGVTRANLELAQARVDLGAAGREEVFRWESQIATNRKDVIAANAQRNQAEIALNRVLNRALEQSFSTVETGLDDPELITSFEQIRPYVENQEAFRLFRQFMVREAFGGSPELRQIDAGILAQERALLASKRALYVPTVALQADMTGFRNGGTGSSSPEVPPDLPFMFPQAGNVNWTVALNASLPLFQGGALRARRSRAEIELDELTVQREATRQRIEQRIRSILHLTGASFVAIDLSREAAEAAHRNFELVQDSYSEGVLDILRLLDAQNQALVADLVAANAVYDYLIDLMGVQRAVGRFDYYRSLEDRRSFLQRLDEFFEQGGYRIRRGR